MTRSSVDDLGALVDIVDAGSFTRAAARRGQSQPALSRLIRNLEERLGVRLLHRTTRSVAPTEAGAALLRELRPALRSIDDAVATVTAASPELRGSITLTASRHGYDAVLRRIVSSFLALHPHVAAEVKLDDTMVDLVMDGCDAGLRLGGLIDKDMKAIRLGPDVAFAAVASPEFCRGLELPTTPHALAGCRCIGYRAPRSRGIMPWVFEKEGARAAVRIHPTLVLDDGDAILAAALDGVGFAYLFLDQVETHIAEGRLIRVLHELCPPQPGYDLYHPSRRLQSPVLAAFVGHARRSAVR